MAILAVNAGSSTLKFSLHPVEKGQVDACILTGSIQGLEPKGQPELSYHYQGQTTRAILPSNSVDPFETAL